MNSKSKFCGIFAFTVFLFACTSCQNTVISPQDSSTPLTSDTVNTSTATVSTSMSSSSDFSTTQSTIETTAEETATTTTTTTTTATTTTTTTTATTTTTTTTTITTKQTTTSTTAPENLGEHYEISIAGTIVDWITDKNIVYTIQRNPNTALFIDANSGEILLDTPLPGRPAKIRLVNEELYISFPDLQCLKVYSAATYAELRTIYTEHIISSFDFYDDYLLYTEDDQHVQVYRHNMLTGLTEGTAIGDRSFHEANVVANTALGVFYIAESGTTGSMVYCYDFKTMTLQYIFWAENYGYSNWVRRTFLCDDGLYWGEFRLKTSDVTRIERQYSGRYESGMLYVDDRYVVTTYGVYDNSTCKKLVSADWEGECALITESGCLIFTEGNNSFSGSDMYIYPDISGFTQKR